MRKIHPSAVVYPNVKLGKNVAIGANSVIGGEGFGFDRDQNFAYLRIPHIGGTIIGDNVEIGACTCARVIVQFNGLIDRKSFDGYRFACLPREEPTLGHIGCCYSETGRDPVFARAQNAHAMMSALIRKTHHLWS
ncbi:hypothetical protein MUO69_03260 [Candidatus Bathyarchaeota archaeon]|nr:hypothetical protein [Candidatus Bathyarchaeota archaeon]